MAKDEDKKPKDDKDDPQGDKKKTRPKDRKKEEPKDLMWSWKPKELDLTDKSADEQDAVRLWQGGLITLNEGRERIGEEPLPEEDDEENDIAADPRGKQFYFEFSAGGGVTPMGDGIAGRDAEAQLAQQIQDLIDGGAVETRGSGGGSGFPGDEEEDE